MRKNRKKKVLGDDMGVSLLRLTDAWRKSKPPREPDPKRHRAFCFECNTLFFGDTFAEANNRKLRHRCRR